MIDQYTERAPASMTPAVEVQMSYPDLRVLRVSFLQMPGADLLVRVITAMAVTPDQAAVDLNICGPDLDPSLVVVAETPGPKGTYLPPLSRRP